MMRKKKRSSSITVEEDSTLDIPSKFLMTSHLK